MPFTVIEGFGAGEGVEEDEGGESEEEVVTDMATWAEEE